MLECEEVRDSAAGVAGTSLSKNWLMFATGVLFWLRKHVGRLYWDELEQREDRTDIMAWDKCVAVAYEE